MALTRILLADTSAFHHASHGSVVDAWTEAASRFLIAVTPPVRLEVLYSATSPAAYEQIRARLDDFRQIPCGDDAFARAEEVQALLSLTPMHHRAVKLNDLLIAAAAELGNAVVWHYDEDYDRIAEITGQPVEWIAPRGSLATTTTTESPGTAKRTRPRTTRG